MAFSSPYVQLWIFSLHFGGNLAIRFWFDQNCSFFFSGQDDISEVVFRRAKRERRLAVGFLLDNK
jgi:hypothetical protein